MATKKDSSRLASPGRFALGMFGTSIAMSMIGSRGNFFFSEFFGLGLQYIAIVNVIYAIWDAVNDPLFGLWSDRTRTRFGRRKPWLLLGAPAYLLFSTLFFFPPPAIVRNILIVTTYYGAFRILSETAGTIITINYHSLLPELFKDERQRNKANAIRQALQITGMIIGVALVPLIIDSWGYQLVAVITSGVGILCFVYSVLGCKEDPKFAEVEAPKLFSSLRDLLRGRDFWSVGIAHLFIDATNTLTLSSIPFYVRYALGGQSSDETFLAGAVFVIAIPCLYFAAKLVNRIGARKVWQYSMLIMAVGFGLMYFMHSLIGSILAGLIIGVCFSGVAATLDLMQSRIMDEDTALTGQHREGFIFSVLVFFRKLSGLLISLVFVIIFLVYGFESGANPGEQADRAARAMMTLIPTILTLLAFVASCFAKFEDWKPADAKDEAIDASTGD
jgi:GPH family glycoside/pentoside/hexuronide:cation symporter